jgi:aryl-alcohol dehydrogenase-like predicted oxidoreductase
LVNSKAALVAANYRIAGTPYDIDAKARLNLTLELEPEALGLTRADPHVRAVPEAFCAVLQLGVGSFGGPAAGILLTHPDSARIATTESGHTRSAYSMEYFRFGQTGLKVSQLCLGTMSMGSSAWKGWVLDEDQSIPILRHALDLGITFFDMADWYSTGRNEEVVGKNLLRMSARERLVLATKVFYPMSEDPNDRGLSRKHIASSIDRSLVRMGTDYVDLYVIHAFDADTPVAETMQALHDTVRAGKVRYLGASTMYTWQFAKMNHVAALHGWTPFLNMQCQYNLLYREEEREMLPYCQDQGIAVTTFSPLARGFLAREGGTARTTHDDFQEYYGDDIDREIARRVREVATRRGVSAAHVATAWVAGSHHRNVPIVGAAKTAHLDVAVEALELQLDAAERAFLEAPYRPRDEINDQNPLRRPRALHPG